MLKDLVTSRAGELATNLLLALVWFVFAVRHVNAFLQTGALVMLVFGLSESILVVLFLFRKPATNVAPDLMPWALGICGTLAPLQFVPTNRVLVPAAQLLVWVGALVMLAGIVSLNRSFGIVPAQREIKTGGLYQLVRHPIYASYVFSFTGYLLTNWHEVNLALWFVSLGLMLARVREEEKLLSQDPDYRAFMEKTRWRLIPYVY
jgi:protein-S-isoprenylcysteine O-methyltransferase Ste14